MAEAADGREAVAAYLEHRPQLAILDITMPGVQKPHCRPWWSWNACWITLSEPSGFAMPSMVVTSRPSQSTANIRQEFTELPSTRIVQVPHCAMPQPNFVPVRPA